MLRLLLRFDLLEDDLEAIAGRWKKVTDVFGSALVEIVELLWSSFQRLDAGAVRVGVHSVVQVVFVFKPINLDELDGFWRERGLLPATTDGNSNSHHLTNSLFMFSFSTTVQSKTWPPT